MLAADSSASWSILELDLHHRLDPQVGLTVEIKSVLDCVGIEGKELIFLFMLERLQSDNSVKSSIEYCIIILYVVCC